MTDRERAVIMAFTGYVMLRGEKLKEFYEYISSLFGRPIHTHEIPGLMEEIHVRSRDDFLHLCA